MTIWICLLLFEIWLFEMSGKDGLHKKVIPNQWEWYLLVYIDFDWVLISMREYQFWSLVWGLCLQQTLLYYKWTALTFYC